MKKLIRTGLVVALLLGTGTGYANEINETAPKTVSNELTFTKVKKGHQVSIKDASGSIIYSENINYNGEYINAFNLESLEDGLYTIELSKDYEINIKRFAVTSHKVTFIKGAEKTVFKPVFRVEDSKILISQLAFENNPLKIRIYFEDELIHSETVNENDTILNRVYNLKEDIEGIYKVVITSNNRVYKETFKI